MSRFTPHNPFCEWKDFEGLLNMRKYYVRNDLNLAKPCAGLLYICRQSRRSNTTLLLLLVYIILLLRQFEFSSSEPLDASLPALFRQRDDGMNPWPRQFSGLFRTIPALAHKRKRLSLKDQNTVQMYLKDTSMIQEVAVKTKKKERKSSSREFPRSSYEYLLGTTPQTLRSIESSPSKSSQSPKRLDLREGMTEALNELRSLRLEMEQMRKELASLKLLQQGGELTVDEDIVHQSKIREFEKVAQDVEQWAERILFPTADTNDDEIQSGWTDIPCHKMFQQKLNRNGFTRASVKWMKDSRGPSYITQSITAGSKDNKSEKEFEWPCLRVYSIIDAPCYEVCTYLAQAQHATEYNQLLDQHEDLDTITSHSKICWAQSPQLLFVKPRDFITFCSHRWKRDGTQVVVNQACDSYKGKTATAFAMRGATYICPDPDNPEHRTRIALLAHASPGKDVPLWACRTAVQSLVPIEAYRLFHKINEGIKQCRPELQEILNRQQRENDDDTPITEMVGNNTGGGRGGSIISRHPAGLAQMGFACFWPNGGGEQELGSSSAGQLKPHGQNDDKSNDVNAPIPLLEDSVNGEFQ